jgi:hypothetical protein
MEQSLFPFTMAREMTTKVHRRDRARVTSVAEKLRSKMEAKETESQRGDGKCWPAICHLFCDYFRKVAAPSSRRRRGNRELLQQLAKWRNALVARA